MAAQLNVGVIGLGILGEQYVSFFRDHPATKVVAVADVRPEQAWNTASRFDAKGYTDYRDMLRQRRLDLVVVATPILCIGTRSSMRSRLVS